MKFLDWLAAQLLPPVRPVEVYDDPLFGRLELYGDGTWQGEVTFQHPPTGAESMSVLIDVDQCLPSELQRALYREIVARYDELWPRVAEALASRVPDRGTVEIVTNDVNEPCLCLDPLVNGEPRRWSLQYTFGNEGEYMSYFVQFCEWEIEQVEAVW